MKCIEIKAMKHLNQKGFTIVQAVFILVVLGMLGAYMVTMSTVQQATSTQALMQARAYQAARSGLEWGIAATLSPSSPWDGISNEMQIEGFSVNVTRDIDNNGNIDDVDYTEANSSGTFYPIKSTATYADISSPDYVSRTLEVTVYE